MASTAATRKATDLAGIWVDRSGQTGASEFADARIDADRVVFRCDRATPFIIAWQLELCKCEQLEATGVLPDQAAMVARLVELAEDAGVELSMSAPPTRRMTAKRVRGACFLPQE